MPDLLKTTPDISDEIPNSSWNAKIKGQVKAGGVLPDLQFRPSVGSASPVAVPKKDTFQKLRYSLQSIPHDQLEPVKVYLSNQRINRDLSSNRVKPEWTVGVVPEVPKKIQR